eukprot:1160950-Pelagomonas_calceolata.AAC.2
MHPCVAKPRIVRAASPYAAVSYGDCSAAVSWGSLKGYKGYKGVGLQPENLADRSRVATTGSLVGLML